MLKPTVYQQRSLKKSVARTETCNDIKKITLVNSMYEFNETCKKDWLYQLMSLQGNYTLDFDEDNPDECFLGQGGNGFVLRYLKNGEKYAIKFMLNKGNRNKEALVYQEVQELYTGKISPNFRIPRYHNQGDVQFNSKTLYYIIMDAADGTFKDFLCQIRKQPDHEKKQTNLKAMLKHLSETLNVLHQSNYIHRDIKPENILLKGEYLLLSDFGMTSKQDRCVRKKGPKYWPNPEFIEVCDSALQVIDHQSDIFNLGCLFFYFATGKYPIGRINLDTELSEYEEDLQTIILNMLHYDKARREDDLTKIVASL